MRYLLIVLMLSGCADMYGPIGQGLGVAAGGLSRDAYAVQNGFPPPPQQPQQLPVYNIQQPKQTDYVCMNRCFKSGYQWGMCQNACSF
jgi:hypothetical protein